LTAFTPVFWVATAADASLVPPRRTPPAAVLQTTNMATSGVKYCLKVVKTDFKVLGLRVAFRDAMDVVAVIVNPPTE
jgi:hypothetical protein